MTQDVDVSGSGTLTATLDKEVVLDHPTHTYDELIEELGDPRTAVAAEASGAQVIENDEAENASADDTAELDTIPDDQD